MITALLPDEIFVYGSNLSGNNVGGAALQAKQSFGAEDGIGQGLTGQCYAFPTLGFNLQQLPLYLLEVFRNQLYATARVLPDKTFLLTPVGVGIAGYPKKIIGELFSALPPNIKKVGWENSERPHA